MRRGGGPNPLPPAQSHLYKRLACCSPGRLPYIGADPGGTIPDRASEKRAPVPPDAVAAALDDR